MSTEKLTFKTIEDFLKKYPETEAITFETPALKELLQELRGNYFKLPCDQKGKPWAPFDNCIWSGIECMIVGYDGRNSVNIYLKNGTFEWVPVSSIKRPNSKVVLDADVQCSNEEDGYCEDHDAHKLTHRKPDSLDKLRDDFQSIIDRLTALMERGA